MKYFIYFYMWKRKGDAFFSNAGNSLFKTDGGIVELYESVAAEDDYVAVITHVAEITKEEYARAEANGHLG